jgi:oxygen-independent coproporphyrinogen-3 oxidase
MDQPAGLYIHIPFCLQKCPYCDFYSITDRSLVAGYVDALVQEMELQRSCALTFDTLYLGGGTPSCLDARELKRIVVAARRCFDFLSDVEVTLEVNPGTVTPDQLIAYRRIGINRLSIGVQSLHEDNLRFLGRIHCVTDAVRTLLWARMAGFHNIGVDLIYGLPAQSQHLWIVDLERAVDQRPEHLSCYQLTCEAGTPLGREVKAGRIQLPSDEALADLFECTIDFLEQHGYVHYEISNFARAGDPSNRSRHNQKYWAMKPYLGLGPAAHSFMEPLRWWNHRSVARYIEDLRAGHLPAAGRESLTTEQLMMEAVYLGLRTSEGIDLAAFRLKFGVDFIEAHASSIRDLQEEGFLRVGEERCFLTRKGMACHERIAVMLCGE